MAEKNIMENKSYSGWIIGVIVLIVLGFIFLSNAENIIAYITTNIISLGINLIVISAFIIINYFLYKYTENGLVSNVFQILSLLFLGVAVSCLIVLSKSSTK